MTVQLIHGDCLEVMPTLDAGSVDAVITDPPYYGVKNDAWDNQWKTSADFLTWCDGICALIGGCLADNGSLYWFASPQMAARIEVLISQRLNVLNNIVWSKGASRGGVGGTGIDLSALRRFWTANSERIIFAEKYGSDKPFANALIDGDSTYWDACEDAKRGIFGDYLRAEFDRANVTQRQIAALFPSATGGLTGCVSNWLLGYNMPTKQQYDSMRQYLNSRNGHADYLRREYEDLRRPFDVTDKKEFGDIWQFPIERNAQHPTQKPLTLMEHIITTSTRPGATVLDPFMGSGSTGVACVKTGRNFIGIELDADYFRIAQDRIAEAQQQPSLWEAK